MNVLKISLGDGRRRYDPGWLLPYNTYTSTCAIQRSLGFRASDLERAFLRRILERDKYLRTQESSSFVNSHQREIALKTTVQCVNE